MSRTLSLILIAMGIFALPCVAADSPQEKKSRTFQFTYETVVKDLAENQVARIWIPVPGTTADQVVQSLTINAPGAVTISREPKYQNQILYVEAKGDGSGQISLSASYKVTRHEVSSEPESLDDATSEMFLKADRMVPTGGKSLNLLKGIQLGDDDMDIAQTLYDVVNRHMKYSKEGTGWGRGDSEWACDSKFGNCSDFHSLFISMARANSIPAKFEMGFPLPEKRGSGEIPGYHCWAKFKPHGKGWVPVDISEANKNPKMKDYYFGRLTENRLAFSVGRDITLEPAQAGPPLNFFIYPYVEVDGKQLPDKQLTKKFTFLDIAQEQPAPASNAEAASGSK